MFARRPRMNRRGIGTAVVSSGPAPTPAPLLLTPETGETFEENDTVILHAYPPSGKAFTEVEFYEGVNLLGTASAAPWEYIWTAVPDGSYSITAAATYTDASTATSAAASITVAAAQTFVPTDIGANLDAWYDTDDTANLTITGGEIETITNKNGTGTHGHATQATAGLRVARGLIRGRQGIWFRGNNQGRYPITLAASPIAQVYQYATVIRPRGKAALGNVITGVSGGRISVEGTSWPRNIVAHANSALTGTAAAEASVTHLVYAKMNGAAGELRVDEAATASGTIGTRTQDTPVNLGASNTGSSSYFGAMGDPIILKSATDGERDQIETYLRRKYHTGDPAAKIMFVGDSITVGTGSTDGDGWRSILFANWHGLGKMCGRWIEAIGSEDDIGFPDDCHYGQSGQGIAFMRANLPALIGTGAEQYEPDVMTLLIGTNNVRENGTETWVAGSGFGSTIAEYALLLDDIFTKLPNVKLVVSTIPDINNATFSARAAEFNGNLLAVWAAKEALYSTTIYRWDAFTSLGSNFAVDYADTVHPNDSGYPKLGNGQKPAIVRAVKAL